MRYDPPIARLLVWANRSAFFLDNMSKKAQFTDTDISSAIDDFVATNAPRLAPAVGKNSEVTIYGENPNKYKPILPKLQDDEDDNNVEV